MLATKKWPIRLMRFLSVVNKRRKDANNVGSKKHDPLRDLENDLENDFKHDFENNGEHDPDLAPPPSARSFGSGYAVGLNLLSSVLVGVAIGLGLDKWLGTAPLFILIFMFLGMAAGLRSIWFYMQRLDTHDKK